MIHEFTVYGKVRGQGRPRVDFNRRRTYKAEADRDYERKIKEAYINSGGGHFGGRPLMMIVITHRELPQSRPRRFDLEPDTCKPDASNIMKAVEDALNKIAYDDDRQIICPIALKAPRMRGEEEHMDVIITDEIDSDLMEAKIRGIL